MNTEDKPAALASTEGLGLLPEYAHAFRPRWPGDEGGFTGAQMRLYAMEAVSAERDRVARWLEWTEGGDSPKADEIRKGAHWADGALEL